MRLEGRVEGGDPAGLDVHGGAVVHRGGRVHRDPGMAVLVIVAAEELAAKTLASSMDPNRPGNAGQYLSVLNCASEYGLSLDTCGRECD
jgi:hypothetical protein